MTVVTNHWCITKHFLIFEGMSGHGHGHSHGGGCDDGDDHVTEDERGFAYSLYLKIDTERVQCLNEVEDGSAKYIFKAWDQRLDKEKVSARVYCA